MDKASLRNFISTFAAIFIVCGFLLVGDGISFAAVIFGSTSSAANSSHGASTIVIEKPSSTVEGDLLLAGITFNGGSAKTITPPPGWTLVLRTDDRDTGFGDNADDIGLASYYKFAGASEPVNYSWGISVSDRAAGGIIRYTGVDASNPINALSGSAGIDSSADAPSVTTTADNSMVVMLISVDNDYALGTPSGTTKRYNVQNSSNSGPSASAYDSVKTLAGSTGTKTFSISHSENWVAQTIVLKPAAASTVPVITSQPSDQVVSEGEAATFTAEASGTPTPTVKWQVSTDGGVTWDNVPGSANTTLVLDSASTDQSGYKYHAVFTNLVGSATTDAAMLKVLGQNAFDKGMVSLSFDDGWQSIYDNAIPILNAAGFKSSQSIISNYIGAGGYMDQSEIDTLYATGHDITSHTTDHSDLTTLSTSDLQSEIYGSRDYLIKNVGKPVDSLAYPYDSYNSLVGQALLGAGYLSGRTVDGGFNDKSTDRFALGGQAVERGGTCDGGQPATTLAQVQSWIDTAAANNTWLILVLHQIDNIDANCYGYTPEILQEIVDYLKTSEVDVVTISEGLHKMPGVPTVGDVTSPTITQDDISVSATDTLDAVVNYNPSVSDNIDTSLVAWCVPASGSIFSMGITPVVCSVADSSGNIGSKTFNVNVVDQTAPIISLDGDNPTTIQVHNSYIEPGASVSDNYDTGLVADITGTVDTEVVGTYTVYYNATDLSGNLATQVVRTVNVVDEEAPSTSDDIPAVWKNTDVVITLTCTDNTFCSTVFYTLDGSDPDTSSNYVDGATNWKFTVSDEGQYTVKYFGVDESNNQEGVRTATNQLMIDKTPPVLSFPGDITAEASGSDGENVDFLVTASDTDPVSPEVSCDHVSGSMFILGSTEVSCSATDNAGNTSTGSFNIIVKDTTPPVISVPEDVTKNTTNSDGIAVTFDVPTVSDTVDGTASVTCDKNSGDFFPVDTTTVTCTASDASGNTTTKTFKVTVSLQQVAVGGGGGGGGGGTNGEPTLEIFNLESSDVKTTSLTFTWTTNIPSSSYVIYSAEEEIHVLDMADNQGIPPTYGYAHATPELDTDPKTTDHSVTVTDLNPLATYYLRVVSRGSLAVGGEFKITMPEVEGAQIALAEVIEEVNNNEGISEAVAENAPIAQSGSIQEEYQSESLEDGNAALGAPIIEGQPAPAGQAENNPNPFAASLLSVSSKYFWPLLIILIILIIGYGIYYYLEKKKNKK
jgi:peptidoglycan/xylan/chitin deacetylase (PgdA/CDA1 family)